ncbi:hypothetical protein Tcan_10650 [Toxocara canis]|uniref:Uncharacterized protein n=1 Tax=Toxocara canis TaxID=6265 RepID=A0A0B2VPM5_TOXCA|nr:hypothetical protein Tcan_10650 [Toxocara canis]
MRLRRSRCYLKNWSLAQTAPSIRKQTTEVLPVIGKHCEHVSDPKILRRANVADEVDEDNIVCQHKAKLGVAVDRLTSTTVGQALLHRKCLKDACRANTAIRRRTREIGHQSQLTGNQHSICKKCIQGNAISQAEPIKGSVKDI